MMPNVKTSEIYKQVIQYYFLSRSAFTFDKISWSVNFVGTGIMNRLSKNGHLKIIFHIFQ